MGNSRIAIQLSLASTWTSDGCLSLRPKRGHRGRASHPSHHGEWGSPFVRKPCERRARAYTVGCEAKASLLAHRGDLEIIVIFLGGGLERESTTKVNWIEALLSDPKLSVCTPHAAR